MTATLPWPKPTSHYESEGPRDQRGRLVSFPVDVLIAGVRMRISPTNALAPTTFRTRYHVQCLACIKTLHEATTGPSSYIRQHLKDAHGFEGELGYEDE